ncbi:MAG: hypothetical protein JSV51_08870 [Candidatus Bathyarchaeota archaeon]|nr:MAG: hypothetical protein JSV51_08870 [Candidatus Bathyarchaeota archaeon]
MQSSSTIGTELRKETGLDIDSAIDWIINSGIQKRNGSFYAWYDLEKRNYSFSYPEVTGYAIQLLTRLYKVGKNDDFLDKAIAAGEWISNIWKKNGCLYSKYYERTCEWDRSQYVFDVGICLSSLLELCEETSDMKYAEVAMEMGNWILMLQTEDGSFFAGLDSEENLINTPHWSQTKGCHHLKVALALLKLFERTQERKYRRSIRKLLEWGIRLQSPSGGFSSFAGNKETYAHAHCYAVEGMLFSSRLFNAIANPSLFEHSIYAASWLSKAQNEDGSIWNWHNSKREKMKVSDALSQAIRIWAIAKNQINENKTTKLSYSIRKGLDFLRTMQCLSGNRHSYGGIHYAQQNDVKVPHINTWATLFAINASIILAKRNDPRLIEWIF